MVLDEAEGLKASGKRLKTDSDREAEVFNVSEIQRLQREDPTLQPLWQAVKGERTKANVWFYVENGMLYRHWQPLVEGGAVSQLSNWCCRLQFGEKL